MKETSWWRFHSARKQASLLRQLQIELGSTEDADNNGATSDVEAISDEAQLPTDVLQRTDGIVAIM